MNTQILDKMTAELTRVFNNPAELAEYNQPIDQSVCFGWDGRALSPVTRVSYINTYGADTVEAAEKQARALLAANADTYGASNYARHMAEAQQAEATHAAPKAGAFVLAINSGLKADGGRGLFNELEEAARDPEWMAEKEAAPRLCKVVEVLEVNAAEFTDPATADRLVIERTEKGEQFPGGAATEDAERQDIADEYRYYFTLAAAVVCRESGRWFLIDSEGYSYARYIFMPTNWREQFAAEFAEEVRKENERREAEVQKEAEEKEARRVVYMEKVAKYAPVMEDLAPYLKEEGETFNQKSEAARAHGYRSPEYKAAQKLATAKAAATTAARKRNLINMARVNYPGIKVKAQKSERYYGAFDVVYIDGPRLEVFDAANDYALFLEGWTGRDYYGDTYNRAEFPEFAEKYMKMGYYTINTEREWSDETRAQLVAAVLEIVPQSAPEFNQWDNAHQWTADELRAISERTGANCSGLLMAWERNGEGRFMTAEGVARWCFDVIDYPVTAPTEPEKPKKSEKTATTKAETTEATAAPAEGLQLVAIAGGVAVVGTADNEKARARQTYKNRKAIKAHGAKWNDEAKQWQATEPEAVAQLRAWLGDETTEPAEGTAESYTAQLQANNQKGRALSFRIGSRALVAVCTGEAWDLSNADGTGTQYQLTAEELADVLAAIYSDRDTLYKPEEITRTADGIDVTADGLELRAVVVGAKSGEIENAFLTIEEAHAAGYYDQKLEADPAEICNGSEGYRGGRLLFECCRDIDAGTNRIAYGHTIEAAAWRYRNQFFGVEHAGGALPEWLRVGVVFCLIDWKTGKPTATRYTCTEIDEGRRTITTPEMSDTFRDGSHVSPWSGWCWRQFAPVTDGEPEPTKPAETTTAPTEKSPAEMNEAERREFLNGLITERVAAGCKKLAELPKCAQLYAELYNAGQEEAARVFRSIVIFTCMLHPDWTDEQIILDFYNKTMKHHDEGNQAEAVA